MGHRPAIAQDGSAVSVSTGCNNAVSQLWICIAQAAVGVFHVEPEEVVQRFRGCRPEIPAQANTHSQLRGYLPVIFTIRREVFEDVRLRVTGLVWVGKGRSSRYKSANPREIPQHHVGHGIAGTAKWCRRSPADGDGWVGATTGRRVVPRGRTPETPIAVEIVVQIAGHRVPGVVETTGRRVVLGDRPRKTPIAVKIVVEIADQRVRAVVEAQPNSVASADH